MHVHTNTHMQVGLLSIKHTYTLQNLFMFDGLSLDQLDQNRLSQNQSDSPNQKSLIRTSKIRPVLPLQFYHCSSTRTVLPDQFYQTSSTKISSPMTSSTGPVLPDQLYQDQFYQTSSHRTSLTRPVLADQLHLDQLHLDQLF